MKIISASFIPLSTSVEKNRFFPLQDFTNSSRPGSYIGKLLVFQAAIFSGITSTTVTLYCGHLCAIIAMVGPPTYPAPIHKRFFLNFFEAIFFSKFFQ